MISRRRGSAIALNTSVVVAALGMRRTLYSYMGICQGEKLQLPKGGGRAGAWTEISVFSVLSVVKRF
jgi:hypothetical protein